LAAATGKARLPTEDSLYDGTTRRLVAEEERRGRRSAISAVQWHTAVPKQQES